VRTILSGCDAGGLLAWHVPLFAGSLVLLCVPVHGRSLFCWPAGVVTTQVGAVSALPQGADGMMSCLCIYLCARVLQEREAKKREAAQERERKAEEKRKAAEEKRRCTLD
jgi:hypothetical protein